LWKSSALVTFRYLGPMRRRALGLLAVGLLTVSCSGGGQKGAAPPPPVTSSPASPSPTPSPTPFVSSADEQGAFEFVRAYYDALNHAVATGDTTRLHPFRADTCSCTKSERDVSSAYSNGGRVEGTHLQIQDLLLGQSGPAFAKVTVQFHTSPGRQVDGAGGVKPLTAVSGSQFVYLTRDGDHWLIDDIKTELT
jgi:hypothetical protein